jgi:hypothetical protein
MDHYCYMVNGAGEVVNLDYLCLEIVPQLTEVASVEDAVPMAGQVCDDFASWGEAQYHFEAGSAPSSLDGDNDGIACEDPQVFANRPSEEVGDQVATYRSNKYTGVVITLYDVARRHIDGEFYLNVDAPGIGIFSTRSFSSKDAANLHMRDYYGFTQGL